jgi:hypothetical protein
VIQAEAESLKTGKRIAPTFLGTLLLLSIASCSRASDSNAGIDPTLAGPATIFAWPDGCPSGECAPQGDLPSWRQIFVDEFVESVAPGEWSGCTLSPFVCSGLPEPYRSRWWSYTDGWPDTSGNGVYSPSRVLSIENGVLDIHIHSENGTHRVAAPLPLIHGAQGPLGQLYGRYAIRFRTEVLPGYKIAWLLWPDSETWPRDGEIDFPEGNLDGMISAFMHHQDAKLGNDQDAFSSGLPTSGGWYTAVIEWTRDFVRFSLDGRILGQSTGRIPDTSMHWVLQTETNLDGYDPQDAIDGHIQVDWVAVYAVK